MGRIGCKFALNPKSVIKSIECLVDRRDLSDATTPGDPLLPPMTNLRAVSAAVAARVAATAAEEGLARAELTDLVQQVHAAMWRPEYPRITATQN